MKNITKRDIADISLVWISLCLVPYLFNFVAVAIYEIASADNIYGEGSIKVLYVLVSFLRIALTFAILWFTVYKRSFLLDILFPDAQEKNFELSKDSAVTLTDYSFWIKIFGLYIGLRSGIQLISNLFRVFGIKPSGQSYFTFVWSYCGTYIITFILSVFVIWKAREIAKYLKRLDNNNKS